MLTSNTAKSLSASNPLSEYGHYYNDLRQGFFLSAMQEVTNGRFCAESNGGCAMVQLGIWFAEPTATKKAKGQYARSFLPDDPDEYYAYFVKEIKEIRGTQRETNYTYIYPSGGNRYLS